MFDSCIRISDLQNDGRSSRQMPVPLRIFNPLLPAAASIVMSANLPPSSALLQQRLEEARQGDPEAVDRLLNAQRSYLLLLAEAELESDLRVKASASDVVQDTIVKAHQSIEDFRGCTALQWRHWLQAILKNNVRDLRVRYVESAKRSIQKEVYDADDGGPTRFSLRASHLQRWSPIRNRSRRWNSCCQCCPSTIKRCSVCGSGNSSPMNRLLKPVSPPPKPFGNFCFVPWRR